MKASETNAAKRGGINSEISKLLGTPHNVSAQTGGIAGSATKASKRPAVNSEITGMKWGESPNDFGKGV